MSMSVSNNKHLRGTEFPIADDAQGRVRKGVISIDGVSLSFDVFPARSGTNRGIYWPIRLRYANGARRILRAVDVEGEAK